jgi:hypothetical protein
MCLLGEGHGGRARLAAQNLEKKIIVMNYKISGQKFICCNNV